MIEFSISGIETYWWLPIVVAFAISSITSTAGISGAFLLLPFQMSVLGFVGPAVTPTNLVYNIVAIPSGIRRFWREGRMLWSLACAILLTSLPGIFMGAVIRIVYLPNPQQFKAFVGFVLLYIGVRLCRKVLSKNGRRNASMVKGAASKVSPLHFGFRTIEYEFQGERYTVSTGKLSVLSFAVGIIGGIYGVGGGAIIAPFLVSFFGLPIHTIAGASLLGTFASSIAGVVFYTIIAPFYADTGLAIAPDWMLGALFGLGGAAGTYVGARMQRFLPARMIEAVLTCCLFVVAFRYVGALFPAS